MESIPRLDNCMHAAPTSDGCGHRESGEGAGVYHQVYVGDEAWARRDALCLSHPMQRGVVKDWGVSVYFMLLKQCAVLQLSCRAILDYRKLHVRKLPMPRMFWLPSDLYTDNTGCHRVVACAVNNAADM